MANKLSVLWVKSRDGRRLHRKREYGAKSKTLCGLHVTPAWIHVGPGLGRTIKCKRCAA